MKTRFFIDANGVYLGGFGGHVAMVDGKEVEVIAERPRGALEIDVPPEHAFDVLSGFSSKGGKASGGTWNTDNRPKPAKSAEERVIDALQKSGVLDKKQADKVKQTLSQ